MDIPQNSGTIKQVVQIAQSQFGGDIAVAVRSPSVRQLVMLYSEATGQKMPLSATTPYAGSLVEQGGNLYQQASYQDGQAHVTPRTSRRSAGSQRERIPTPGGPNTAGGTGATYLSLNVSGSRRRELHDRPVRDAAVRDGPVDGGAVFELWPHAAVGQHAVARIDGGVIHAGKSHQVRHRTA